tara:strand:- start:358 stop:522 length:165 start_codon:yes stop_codon:yes gene_type:complete
VLVRLTIIKYADPSTSPVAGAGLKDVKLPYDEIAIPPVSASPWIFANLDISTER